MALMERTTIIFLIALVVITSSAPVPGYNGMTKRLAAPSQTLEANITLKDSLRCATVGDLCGKRDSVPELVPAPMIESRHRFIPGCGSIGEQCG